MTQASPPKTFDTPPVAETTRAHIAAFHTLTQGLPGAGTPGLEGFRAAALDRFTEAGLPTRRLEDWKFTGLDRLVRAAFVPRAALLERAVAVDPDLIHRLAPLQDATRLVFVNGGLRADLSTPFTQTGPRVVSLAEALDDPDFKAKLTTGDGPARALVALNAAFMSGGAVIELAGHAGLEKPVVLLFLTGGEGDAVHTRNVLALGPHARARVVEIHATLPDTPASFSNAVTDVALGEGADLHHIRIAAEAPGALHHSFAAVAIAENAHYHSFALSVGGDLSRQETEVHFKGTGGHASLYGAYLGRGHQHMDHTVRVHHDHPGCVTEEIFKGALDDHAHGVFQGLIRVAPHAIKTDARQKNSNLLLSDRAVADIKPELEILADDVKCAHGATVGDLDPDEMFYLLARGIPPIEARRLLLTGYMEDLIDRLGDETLAGVLRAHTDSWLAGESR